MLPLGGAGGGVMHIYLYTHKMPLEGFERGLPCGGRGRKGSLEYLELSHMHTSPTKMRIKLGTQETRSQGDMITRDTGDETSHLETLDSEACLDVLGA